MKKRLSIVIPVYNLEKYIGQCLDSCINQDVDFDQYEILCIDDGSKDKSLSIMKKYENKYKNIKVISKDNSGVSDTRNLGIDLSIGEYIWFIDGDDVIRNNCINSLLERLEKDKLDILMLSSKFVQEQFKLEDKTRKLFEFNNVVNGLENTFKLFPTKSSGSSVYNYIIKKQILEKENIRFIKDMSYAEDTLFVNTVRLYINNAIVVDEIIYYYRQRNGSAMHTRSIESKKQHLKSMKMMINEYTRQINYIDLPYFVKEQIMNRIYHATQNILFDLLYMDNQTVSNTIDELKNLGIYPYKFRFENLKLSKNIKSNIINYITFMFPCEIYFKIFHRIASKIIQKKYIREK